MRLRGLPINALPLFPGLFLGPRLLSLCVGLSPVKLWSGEPWGTPGRKRVSGNYGRGEAPAQWSYVVLV